MVKTKLVTDKVWPAIQAAAEKARGRKLAAVAYVGVDGAELLSDFGENDVLVCNMGFAALRTGATNPEAIEKLLARGVYVFSHDRLHAKVYVLGSVAFVGSANVSDSAANRLAEAMTRTTEQTLVADARRFVRSTCRDALPVTTDFLEIARTVYRRPRGASDARSSNSDQPDIRLRVEEYIHGEAPDLVEEHYWENRDVWQAEAGPISKWYMDISWDNDPRWIRPNDWVLWIYVGTDPPEVLAPMKVLGRVPVGGRSSQIVTWYRAANRNRLPRNRVEGRVLASAGYRIQPGKIINNAAAVDALFDLWKLSRHE